MKYSLHKVLKENDYGRQGPGNCANVIILIRENRKVFCPWATNLDPCGSWCPFFEIQDDIRVDGKGLRVTLSCSHCVKVIVIDTEEENLNSLPMNKKERYEKATKELIEIQGCSIITGPIIYSLYRDKCGYLASFESYATEGISGKDAYLITKRIKEESK